jgi:hypothetical protein
MIFGRRRLHHSGGQRFLAVIIAPLRHIIILDAIDGRALPITAARQLLDIGDMDRCEVRRQLDGNPPARSQVDHQQIVGRNLRPFRRLRRGDHVGRGLRLGRGRGLGSEQGNQG